VLTPIGRFTERRGHRSLQKHICGVLKSQCRERAVTVPQNQAKLDWI
jgi:hypothetical protein